MQDRFKDERPNPNETSPSWVSRLIRGDQSRAARRRRARRGQTSLADHRLLLAGAGTLLFFTILFACHRKDSSSSQPPTAATQTAELSSNPGPDKIVIPREVIFTQFGIMANFSESIFDPDLPSFQKLLADPTIAPLIDPKKRLFAFVPESLDNLTPLERQNLAQRTFSKAMQEEGWATLDPTIKSPDSLVLVSIWDAFSTTGQNLPEILERQPDYITKSNQPIANSMVAAMIKGIMMTPPPPDLGDKIAAAEPLRIPTLIIPGPYQN